MAIENGNLVNLADAIRFTYDVDEGEDEDKDNPRFWYFLGRTISEDDDVNYEIQEAIDNADKDDLADLIYDVYFGDDDYLKFFKDLHIKECD